MTKIINFFQTTFHSTPYAVSALLAVIFLLLIIQTIRLHVRRHSLRSDAIKRSKAVIGGQVFEQVAPYLPNFPCNPADAKFLGKPVDFVAFPGLSESDDLEEILFIEVKTGESQLSSRERQIKEAVRKGKIRYVEYRI